MEEVVARASTRQDSVAIGATLSVSGGDEVKMHAAWLSMSLSLCLLAACNRAPPAADGFSLDKEQLTFQALQHQPLPPAQKLHLKLSDPRAKMVGSAPRDDSDASWLSARVEGRAPDVTVVVSITNTRLKPGDYHAQLIVATGDDRQNTLKSRDVEVRYRVLRP